MALHHAGEPGEGGMVDDNGMPIELPYDSRPPEGVDPGPPPEDGPVLDPQWIEEQTGRRGPGDNAAVSKNGSQPKMITVPKAPAPVVKTPTPPRTQPDASN